MNHKHAPQRSRTASDAPSRKSAFTIPSRLPSRSLILLALAFFAPFACAQNDQTFSVVGYITAVPAHSGNVTEFDVNAQHVVVSDNTSFGLIGSRTTTNYGPLRSALQIGAFVKVVGKTDRKTKATVASTIFLRPDWDAALTGIGVIDKVLKPASEPVFRADGYFVRLTKSTKVTLAPGVSSIQNVGVNSWISFEGKQSSSGELVASKVLIMPEKSTAYRGLFGAKHSYSPNLIPATAKEPKPTETSNSKGEKIVTPVPDPEIDPQTGRRVDFEKLLDKDGNLTQDAGIRMGALHIWHLIPASTPAEQAMQARVRRIGERLIPAYQKALPADAPSKIRFEFYAFDDKRLRSDFCPSTGLILIPVQVIDRLQNDDQLAAILADGIAYNLQRQAARRADVARKMLGPAIAANLLLQASLLGVVPIIAEKKAGDAITLQHFEERGRISMGLLADADYDPWQVPEAWKLLEPKHAAHDASTLAYNDYAGYLLSILNLEYPKSKPAAS